MRFARLFGVMALGLAGAHCAAQEPEAAGGIDEDAIFTSAGFHKVGAQWQACEATDSASYAPARIDLRRDFNGDGQPEALVVEESAICYGMTGMRFAIVSQQQDGDWRLIVDGIGIPEMLETTGVDGWPDIEVGGPGFCFPVLRWTGSEYEIDRFEYEGEPCSPSG